MTVPLAATSPRREYARRFGATLREVMADRKIGGKTLAKQIGVAPSAVASWRGGFNLPTLKTALRISEGLQAPELYEIAKDARCGVCPTCGKAWINEGGKPKIYCSQDCRARAEREKSRGWRPDADLVFLRRIEAMAAEPGSIRKRDLTEAATEFRSRRGRTRIVAVQREYSRHQAAVEAFCRSCEWDGFCKTPECELRPVSPLPLEPRIHIPEPVERAKGSWSEESRDKTLAAIREANAERWNRPGERERASQRTRRWWETMTPEERIATARKISERRKGQATRRECGCPNRRHLDDCPRVRAA